MFSFSFFVCCCLWFVVCGKCLLFSVCYLVCAILSCYSGEVCLIVCCSLCAVRRLLIDVDCVWFVVCYVLVVCCSLHCALLVVGCLFVCCLTLFLDYCFIVDDSVFVVECYVLFVVRFVLLLIVYW